MNKKTNTLFFSFLVLVYITVTVGIPVYLHYCGGELETVSAFVKDGSCCEGEDEDEPDGCCKNETKHVLFKVDFLDTKPVKPGFLNSCFVVFHFFVPNVLSDFNYTIISHKSRPPEITIFQKLSDSIFTSVFRI